MLKQETTGPAISEKSARGDIVTALKMSLSAQYSFRLSAITVQVACNLEEIFIHPRLGERDLDMLSHCQVICFLNYAALAQLVEHIIRNDGVRCSNHLSGTMLPQQITMLPHHINTRSTKQKGRPFNGAAVILTTAQYIRAYIRLF